MNKMNKLIMGKLYCRTWCMMKAGGRVVIGVPVHPEERILYNNARVYSKVLLKHLFANWKQVSDCNFLHQKTVSS